MDKKVVIIGAGGHSRVVADIVRASGDRIFGFLDDKVKKYTCADIIGNVDDATKFQSDILFVMAIGDNYIRKRIAEKYTLNWYTAIHPSAIISNSVKIADGTVVMPNAVINANAAIGTHSIINTSAVVEHDSVIEDFCHIAPRAALGGTTYISELTHIGIGASVINNITVCKKCIIGAGAVVIRNITESGTYVGVPAVKIKGEHI